MKEIRVCEIRADAAAAGAAKVLKLEGIITGLLAAIPDYIELCTGIPAEAQKTEPLADTAGKFILTLWYHAERVDADKIQRTIDSLLKTLQLKAERG